MAKGVHGNLLEFLPKDLKEECFEDLTKCDGVRIERIVSKGQVRHLQRDATVGTWLTS